MLDPVSGAMSAAGDMGSAVISGLFGAHSAKKSMKFQEQMSNTAYQRAAVDLEKAGLNRVLALGSPSSTPSGATATMPDSKMGSSFFGGSNAKSAQRVNEETIKLLQQQQQKTHHESLAAAEQAENIRADTAVKVGNASMFPWQQAEINARLPTYKSTMDLQDSQKSVNTQNARFLGTQADKQEWQNKKFTALNPMLDFLIDDVLTPLSNSAREAAKNAIQNAQDKGDDIPWKEILAPGGLHAFKRYFKIP